MKTLVHYQLQPGMHSLKWYTFWTPGLKPFKSKARILKALNLGLIVFCKDKIMKTTTKWDGENWV